MFNSKERTSGYFEEFVCLPQAFGSSLMHVRLRLGPWRISEVATIFCFILAVSNFVTIPAGSAEKIAEYVDYEYGFAFQYPSNWSIHESRSGLTNEDVLIIIESPEATYKVMATVGQLGASVSRQSYFDNPHRDKIVNAMIEFTISQIYTKSSFDMDADDIHIAEKMALQSDTGIRFRITAGIEVSNKILAMSGIHTIPFDKSYMISFIAVIPVGSSATYNNEIIANIFNSFHLRGE